MHPSGVKDLISGETDARSTITRTKVFVSGLEDFNFIAKAIR